MPRTSRCAGPPAQSTRGAPDLRPAGPRTPLRRSDGGGQKEICTVFWAPNARLECFHRAIGMDHRMASLAVILALLAPPAVVTGYGACGALNRSVCSCGDGCKATGGACSCLSCGSCSNCADGPHCNCVSCTCCHLHAQSYFGRPDKDEHSRDRDVEYVRTYDDDQHDELSGAHCGSLVATLEHELSLSSAWIGIPII